MLLASVVAIVVIVHIVLTLRRSRCPQCGCRSAIRLAGPAIYRRHYCVVCRNEWD
jgi:cbb3-type cytochrome oxidase cytochrome c subunit